MTIITCATCGKPEDRQRWARYCLACGRERARSRQRARSKNGVLRAQVVELVRALKAVLLDRNSCRCTHLTPATMEMIANALQGAHQEDAPGIRKVIIPQFPLKNPSLA